MGGELLMSGDRFFEITAHIDVPPREHAKTDFTKRTSSDRGLLAKLHYLHRDGYSTSVRLPSGRVVPGTMFPDADLMDDDLGYGPKPECEHLMHRVEGTWLLLDDPT